MRYSWPTCPGVSGAWGSGFRVSIVLLLALARLAATRLSHLGLWCHYLQTVSSCLRVADDVAVVG